MRRIIAVPMLLLLLLCACGAEKTSAQTPVQFRTSLEGAGGCDFSASVTADYESYIRQFTLSCSAEAEETSLVIAAPEYAAGITATVSGEEAKVQFGDTVLAVEDFSSRNISPMATPWLLYEAWTQGYISATAMDGELEQVTYLLGYGMDQLTITTNFRDSLPVEAWVSDGKNDLITCEIEGFSLNH